MKKSYICIIAILLLFASCDRTRTSNCMGVYFDPGLFVKVQNELGENLLDKAHPNYINIDTVHMYRIASDGCEVFLYDKYKYADISKGFRVIMINGEIMLQIILDGNGLNLYHYHGDTIIEEDLMVFSPDIIEDCKLLLKWNNQNTDTDTIYTTFVHLKSSKGKPLPANYCAMHLYDKVFYNGEQIVTSFNDNVEKMNRGIYPIIVK